MMRHYSLFYSYKHIGDVLIIIFNNDKKSTKNVRKGQVEIIYHENEIIGYNIFDIRNVVKIKTEGLIYLPSPAFINVINAILKNNGAEELDYVKESGYFIGEIKSIEQIDNEKSLVSIDNKKELINAVTKSNDLHLHDKVVVAIVDTRLNNGELVKSSNLGQTIINGHLCNEKELQISDEDSILILDKDEEIGKDFFTTEAK